MLRLQVAVVYLPPPADLLHDHSRRKKTAMSAVCVCGIQSTANCNCHSVITIIMIITSAAIA